MAFNMDPKKCPMPTQDPNVRNKNFKEVALGYTAEMAVNEAKRCIGCKNKPCLFFFKQKTAYEIVSREWSSDVCSFRSIQCLSEDAGVPGLQCRAN